MMENFKSADALTPVEQGMYEQSLSRFPGLTVEAWKELRTNALAAKNPETKLFYEQNGIVMQEKPDQDDTKEMNPRNMN